MSTGGGGVTCEREPIPIAWTPCRGDRECATVTVPLDYEDPCGATIDLAVLRARAQGERRGSLFVNQGGPGLASVEYLAVTYPAAAAILPATAQVYDVVAIDWRGVGESEPLRCDFAGVNSTSRQLGAPATEADRAAWEAVFEQGRTACDDGRSGDLLGRMGTENAARDMDQVRRAIGDERIAYIGMSYGGYLGAVYMSLFPEHVGAFVLDSPASPTPELFVDLTTWATELEARYEDFFGACGADDACAFHGGEGTDAVRGAFEALLDTTAATGGIAVGERTLTRSDIGKAIYERIGDRDVEGVASDLAAAEAGDGRPLLDEADAYYGDGEDGAFQAIYCLDHRRSASVEPEAYWTFVDDLAAGPAPHVAHDLADGYGLCRAWPYEVSPPTISAPSALPALVVAGLDDVWTPRSFADATIAALANGSRLLLGDAPGHVQLGDSACVHAVVDGFLANPTAELVTTDCTSQ